MAKIKNWSDFQHFKDRRPPWIKLHRDILENRDISSISDCSFRVLVGIWLLASEDKEMQGTLPGLDDIVFRLRMEKSKVIKALKELDSFVIQDDISVISGGYQDDVPETETETETETQLLTETIKPKPKKIKLDYSCWPSLPDDQIMQDWVAMRKRLKAPVSQTVINRFATQLHEAINAGFTIDDCIGEAVTRNWKGFKLEWMNNATGNNKQIGTHSGYEQKDTRSRAQKVGDRVKEIGQRDIDENGLTSTLD